ncbi:hypothetical protein CPAR01_13731 [Colletotrichum paranaense]|uniref:Uncharacterized protein n=1 Tax=Colletotrichum paranaense TaxID=1914294 RepID=A0ABQ9S484_9PEZI|nr:uncharacterized protein CPAR01_13731 [Colletotrichum paranaense]KAK1524783.1 hypothetical protein CPAR01_13731 [Colletotrichum paranaense]
MKPIHSTATFKRTFMVATMTACLRSKTGTIPRPASMFGRESEVTSGTTI